MAQVMKKEFNNLFNTVMVSINNSEIPNDMGNTPIVKHVKQLWMSLEDWCALHDIKVKRCEFTDKPTVWIYLDQMWSTLDHEKISNVFPDYRLRAELRWNPETGCPEDTELVLEIPF